MQFRSKFAVHTICASLSSFISSRSAAFVVHHPTYYHIARQSSFPTASSRTLSSNLSEKSSASSTSSVCEVSSDINIPDLVSIKGSASILRNSILKNANGDDVRLGDCMGNDTSIIVFLRHLA